VTLWGIFKKRDTLAGVALALTTLKPQISFLIVPLVLLWAFFAQRRRLIAAFAGGFITLMAVSFAFEPIWFGDWLERVTGYAGYAETYSTTYILADIFPFDSVLYVIFSGLLLAGMFYFWKHLLWDGHLSELPWVFFLTAAVTLLIAPRTATTSYVMLYPVLYITAMLLSRKKQAGRIWVGGVGLLIGYWLLHILTVPPKDEGGAGGEARIVYVVFPVLILLLLWGYRKSWPLLDRMSQAS
ncbi:MAG: hypothetical protein K8I82_07925, partial [Anaerolineae bacterium]|nr:hypothetical protein [Anaerolineae bacterium]